MKHRWLFPLLLVMAAALAASRANAAEPAIAPRHPAMGLKPLTEMSAADRYKGEDGGLYGQGRNEPPAAHLAAALREAAAIVPLDAAGRPDAKGKIVLISIGMSNTTQEFSRFVQLAAADPQRSAKVILVDGAQNGRDAAAWAKTANRWSREQPSPWDVLQTRLEKASVTANQVQVAWIKEARKNPALLGPFPDHAIHLRNDLSAIVIELKKRFPNVRLAYLSSRVYAGYATTAVNPEPYAYESAFAVRALIQKQIGGDKTLSYSSPQGKGPAPLLLWGPYLWADGQKPRKSDGLVWKPDDFQPDGTHPAEPGSQKVAELLLKFFRTDPTAKPWFVSRHGAK